MKERVFQTNDGLNLIVKSRKSAVIFELDSHQEVEGLHFTFRFTEEEYNEFLSYLTEVAKVSWGKLEPKEAQDMGADYAEYYDRKLDNNGYLSIKEKALVLERPTVESEKLYQFNKKKMESFLYDTAKSFKKFEGEMV